jgi:hypothetical protein
VTRRRLLILGLCVVTALAVVAVVAHGRPLGATAGRGSGLPQSFWDYTLTSMVIIAGILVLGLLGLSLNVRRDPRTKPQSIWVRTFEALAGMMLIALFILYIGPHLHWNPIHLGSTDPMPGTGIITLTIGTQTVKTTGVAQFRWDEVLVVAGILLLVALVVVAVAGRSKPRPFPSLEAPLAVAAALDESLDDLRSDPDLRRAIVAAYARMEAALAGAGVPRRPSEAPLEYVERSLLALDLDSAAVRRLTDLFEWARFSHHEPEPSMRDEAVDALVAVRDSLLAPAEVAA